MPEDTERGANVHGDVAKLTQIGTVHGNVLIVSERTFREASSRLLQSPAVQDVSDYIKVVVKSNRFGRKVQFQVPHHITVGAFIDLIVDTLQLPWSKRIDELMISFDFAYSIVFGEKELPLNQSIHDAGISDGDEVQLSITAIWTDEIEKQEEEVKKDVMYMLTAELLQKQAEIMQKHENARKARGTLTQSKIKALADSCFAFVDKIGT